MERKTNCWEFNRCGREPGGERVEDFGVCPVIMEKRLDGIHGGNNAGRACWVIAGTFCKEKLHWTLAEKLSSCIECEFYTKVREEEGTKFILAPFLLQKIRNSLP